ncbi:Type 1 glutamine amidotransferase-like domain-containing protein [Alkalicoccobacillus murimartini]|uniref:Peptidase E n=1 Tax=Alkalicoccobacillus murimartini TaxID=171685 RepID=A0ABT9YLQ8_9BACI|nr:peptidase E [Alkalicoccobacillus murimartini]MDQ0208778.1 peptidase E [Alkalicoccobacillus murimartini]
MRQIIALGGGGFSMEPDNPTLDDYIVNQAGTANPKICFVPTAGGDQDHYIKRFYDAFKHKPCTPTHLSLFDANFKDLEAFVFEQDIMYVGGGSTRNMLILWREWGLDEILIKAYQKEILLAGISAGAICWFEQGLTDPLNGPLYKIDGLGLLKGSACPHYDGEEKRRPFYEALVKEGGIMEGYGINDGTALHFINESLHRSVQSTKGKGQGYEVVKKK